MTVNRKVSSNHGYNLGKTIPQATMRFSIRLRYESTLRLSAGQTLFKVTNAGTMFHRFEIEGRGMEKEIEPGVDAGQTRTLKLDLKTGAYEVYCPVHGHKKAGMSLRLQVG